MYSLFQSNLYNNQGEHKVLDMGVQEMMVGSWKTQKPRETAKAGLFVCFLVFCFVLFCFVFLSESSA
jgi:hypothetical protein